MLDVSNHPTATVVEDASSFGASGGDHLGASNVSSKSSVSDASASKSQDSQQQFEQLSGQIPDIALTTTDQFRLVDEIMDLDLGDGGGSSGGNTRRDRQIQGISHSSASTSQSRLNPSAYHRQMSYPRNE